jgi:hypothetical protein
MEVLAPSEKEKETAHRVGAGNVGAPATLVSFVLNVWKERKKERKRTMIVHLDRLAP